MVAESVYGIERARVPARLVLRTGITAYLNNGGRLEIAQQMAAHESARTTGLYDRRSNEISLDEVERIGISFSGGPDLIFNVRRKNVTGAGDPAAEQKSNSDAPR